MSPITHALISWVSAEKVSRFGNRERFLCVLAGIIPDIDGIGIIADFSANLFGVSQTFFYQTYHHKLHTIAFCIFYCGIASLFVKKESRFIFFLISVFLFHVHILCDLIGSKGPDGHHWPIPYFYPLNESFLLEWSGQWELASWQNFSITLLFMLLTFLFAVNKGYSIVGLFSKQADEVFIKVIRRWYGK